MTVDTPLVALRHVRVIDGMGGDPRDDRMLVIRNGLVESEVAEGSAPPPAGALAIDMDGHTVLPGLVMMHEHLFYPSGPFSYLWSGFSFSRLLLASGVTTARTAGAINPYADLGLRALIGAGVVPGPDLDVTGPILEAGTVPIPGIRVLKSPGDARRVVGMWADEGVTSVKIYTRVDSVLAAAVISEAHARGLKVAGHVCALTLREAADLNIDALEHGLFSASDFDVSKTPGACPPTQLASVASLRPDDHRLAELAKYLAQSGVAITSTLPVFETYLPGRAAPDSVLSLLHPTLEADFRAQHVAVDGDTTGFAGRVYDAASMFERLFVREGGLLLVGTDPTGHGGVVPGWANAHALELLVAAGLTPLEAIRAATFNGARYLGREAEIGSIAPGLHADLVIVDGNPAADITAMHAVTLVFRGGVGYDPARLRDGLKGTAGWR